MLSYAMIPAPPPRTVSLLFSSPARCPLNPAAIDTKRLFTKSHAFPPRVAPVQLWQEAQRGGGRREETDEGALLREDAQVAGLQPEKLNHLPIGDVVFDAASVDDDLSHRRGLLEQGRDRVGSLLCSVQTRQD
eukprot:1880029-Rhodomonas_salina.1